VDEVIGPHCSHDWIRATYPKDFSWCKNCGISSQDATAENPCPKTKDSLSGLADLVKESQAQDLREALKIAAGVK
jgi:hypothetical protein